MKYCSKCGNQLLDEAVICPKCGCMVGQVNTIKQNKVNISNDVTESEICPSSFRWLLISLIGIAYLCFLFIMVFRKYALGFLILALMFVCAVVGMCIYGIIKKWNHYLVGSKPYPIQFGITLGASVFLGIISIIYYFIMY